MRYPGIGVLTLYFSLAASAQTTFQPYTLMSNATRPPVEGVGHDYIHDLSETVNPASGQLSIRIAAPMPRERALNFPTYAFMWDSTGRFGFQAEYQAYCSVIDDQGDLKCIGVVSAPTILVGFAPAQPSILNTDELFTMNSTEDYPTGQREAFCSYNGPYIYEDASGGFHNFSITTGFRSSAFLGCPVDGISPAYSDLYNKDPHFKAVVNSSATSIIVTNSAGDMFFGAGIQNAEDTNGNHGLASGRAPAISIQTNDGTIPHTYLNKKQILSIDYPGITGSYTYQYGPVSVTPNALGNLAASVTLDTADSVGDCKVGLLDPVSGTPVGGPDSVAPVTGVGLPEGLSYQFGYDYNTGLIDKITYPNGATVQYAWGINPQSEWIYGSFRRTRTLEVTLVPATTGRICPQSPSGL